MGLTDGSSSVASSMSDHTYLGPTLTEELTLSVPPRP